MREKQVQLSKKCKTNSNNEIIITTQRGKGSMGGKQTNYIYKKNKICNRNDNAHTNHIQ